MGAENVRACFERWPDLPHRAFRLLSWMALRSLDRDPEPTYFAGWQELAKAVGLDPESRSGEEVVGQCLRTLKRAGAVRQKSSGRRGSRAEYVIVLPGKPQRNVGAKGSVSPNETLSQPQRNVGVSPNETLGPKRTEEEEETTPLPPSRSQRRRGHDAGTAEGDQHQPHCHEPNVRRSLAALGALPLTADEILAACYAIGLGDPWAGYLAAKPDLTRSLDGATDRAATLRARLRRLTGSAA